MFHHYFHNRLEFWGRNLYCNTAVPYTPVVQFYPRNFSFQILMKCLVVGVGNFMSELSAARLVLGWVTVFGRVYHLGM